MNKRESNPTVSVSVGKVAVSVRPFAYVLRHRVNSGAIRLTQPPVLFPHTACLPPPPLVVTYSTLPDDIAAAAAESSPAAAAFTLHA